MIKCPVCDGKGWTFFQGDLHKSSGSIPCTNGCVKGHFTKEAWEAKQKQEKKEKRRRDRDRKLHPEKYDLSNLLKTFRRRPIDES